MSPRSSTRSRRRGRSDASPSAPSGSAGRTAPSPRSTGIDRDAAERVVERALADASDVWLTPADARELLLAYGMPARTRARRRAARRSGRRGRASSASPSSSRPRRPARTRPRSAASRSTSRDADAVRAAATRIGGAADRPADDRRRRGAAGRRRPGPGLRAAGRLRPGRVFAELIGDAAFRIAPLTDRDAEELVYGGKAGRLVRGFRGAPAADGAALADLLLRLARLGEDIPAVAELDLNPVLALPTAASPSTLAFGCSARSSRARAQDLVATAASRRPPRAGPAGWRSGRARRGWRFAASA